MKLLTTILLLVSLPCSAAPELVAQVSDWYLFTNEEAETVKFYAASNVAVNGAYTAVSLTCRNWSTKREVTLEFNTLSDVKSDDDMTVVITQVDMGRTNGSIVELRGHGTKNRKVLAAPLDAYSQNQDSLLKGNELRVQFMHPDGTHSTRVFSLMGFTKALIWVSSRCVDPFDNRQPRSSRSVAGSTQ